MSCVSAHFVHTLYKAEKSSTAKRTTVVKYLLLRRASAQRRGDDKGTSKCMQQPCACSTQHAHISRRPSASLRPDLCLSYYYCTLQITTVLKHTHTTLCMRHAGPVPEYCKLAIRLPPTPSGTGHESIYRIPMVHSAHVLASALRPPVRNLIRPASCAGRCAAATR